MLLPEELHIPSPFCRFQTSPPPSLQVTPGGKKKHKTGRTCMSSWMSRTPKAPFVSFGLSFWASLSFAFWLSFLTTTLSYIIFFPTPSLYMLRIPSHKPPTISPTLHSLVSFSPHQPVSTSNTKLYAYFAPGHQPVEIHGFACASLLVFSGKI